MLQQSWFAQTEAAQAFGTPTYAYARNNPVRYTDPDGLQVPTTLPIPWIGPIPIPAPSPWIGVIPILFWPNPTAPSTCDATGGCGSPQPRPGSLGPTPGQPQWPVTPSIPDFCQMAGAAAAAKTASCIVKATNAMNMCLSQGKTVAQCSHVFDIVFAGCMGFPIPTTPPSIH